MHVLWEETKKSPYQSYLHFVPEAPAAEEDRVTCGAVA